MSIFISYPLDGFRDSFAVGRFPWLPWLRDNRLFDRVSPAVESVMRRVIERTLAQGGHPQRYHRGDRGNVETREILGRTHRDVSREALGGSEDPQVAV